MTPLLPSTGAPVRNHRNGVRNRSESLAAFNRNSWPHSSESAIGSCEQPREVCCGPRTTLRQAGACSVQKGAYRRSSCIGPGGQPDDCESTDEALANVKC